MELARMTSKGQLTIPVSIRKKFGIGTGDQLLFYEHDGHIILAPVTNICPPKFILKRKKKSSNPIRTQTDTSVKR